MASRAISCVALIGILAPSNSFIFRAPVPKVRRLFADQGEASSNSPPTEDWRDFRARLVAQESGATKSAANGDQAWAYETSLVEVSSSLHSKVEQLAILKKKKKKKKEKEKEVVISLVFNFIPSMH